MNHILSNGLRVDIPDDIEKYLAQETVDWFLAEISRQVEKREEQLYVPGNWTCDECGFVLVSMTMCASTGEMGANNWPHDCANGHGPMRRTTEREARMQAQDTATELFEQVRVLKNAGVFQGEVHKWMLTCFGEDITADRDERNHRFLEEALELVQSTGCTAEEAHQLVDYVFNRPVGDPPQECGGVMVTLAAWCIANKLDLQQCARTELDRIWLDIPKIRAKQAAKPRHSPLPQ